MLMALEICDLANFYRVGDFLADHEEELKGVFAFAGGQEEAVEFGAIGDDKSPLGLGIVSSMEKYKVKEHIIEQRWKTKTVGLVYGQPLGMENRCICVPNRLWSERTAYL